MSADTRYVTPRGTFRLRRYPRRRDEPLLAWCAADSLLHEELLSLGVSASEVLVVNDEHGALAVPLQARALWTDSALSALALEQNLEANALPRVDVIWSTASPPAAAVVALRIPKQLHYLEYQLGVLAALLPPDTCLLAAGMDKHLSPHVAAMLERYIGPTERHRGQRKARLFSARRDARQCEPVLPATSYYCAAAGGDLLALPNVFSRDKLDGGSGLLLTTLDQLASLSLPSPSLVDLACGNGVLGIAALRRGIGDSAVFADESALAVESARRNCNQLLGMQSRQCRFHHGDGLLGYSGPRAGLILCNPPFHLNHVVDEYAGRHLLAQCAAHLEPGGYLCLVSNRHLDYRRVLQREFNAVQSIARDAKFVVWLAQRR